jgi:hypothetical protein
MSNTNTVSNSNIGHPTAQASDLASMGSDFVQNLGEAVRKNPVSAALIGMGALWLFAGGRPMARATNLARRSGLDRLPDSASDLLDAGRSRMKASLDVLGDGVSSVRDAGSDAARLATEYAKTIPQSGSDLFDSARTNLNELFKAQPLALGAIGIAIGAGIAAALPVSELEQDYLGEASSAVRTKAAEFVSEQGARVAGVAEEVVGAAGEEARRQGLTMDDAKSAVSDLSGKVGRVAGAAGIRS